MVSTVHCRLPPIQVFSQQLLRFRMRVMVRALHFRSQGEGYLLLAIRARATITSRVRSLSLWMRTVVGNRGHRGQALARAEAKVARWQTSVALIRTIRRFSAGKAVAILHLRNFLEHG